MADDLEPLAAMPDELGDDTGVLRRNAQWASTFGGSGTSLAQRHRRNRDIMAYGERVQEEQAAASQHLRQTNKVAQDLWYRGEQLKMEHDRDMHAQDERAMRMEHARDLHPAALAAKEAGTRASLALESARVQSINTKAQLEAQRGADTAGYSKAVSDGLSSGLRQGTPEYTRHVIEARLKFPAADKTVVDDIWKSTNSPLSIDDALEQMKTAQAAGLPNATTTAGPHGVTVTTKPVKETDRAEFEKDRAFYAGQLNAAKNRRERAVKGADKDVIAAADEDVKAFTERLAKLDAHGGAPATAMATAATGSPNQAAMDWIKANPNDPRAAAIKAKLGIP